MAPSVKLSKQRSPDWWHRVGKSRGGGRRAGSLAFMFLPIFLVSWAAEAAPEAPAKATERVETRVVTGELVWVGKRAISVETSRTASTSEEMLIPVDEKTKTERVKSLSELKRGDRVTVSCLETYQENDERERKLVKVVAAKVALVKTAAPEGTLQSSAGAP